MKATNLLTEGIINDLTQIIRKLPGLGSKSALKIALHLAIDKSNIKQELIKLTSELEKNMSICEVCGMISFKNKCQICLDTNRSNKQLCIIEKVPDVFAIENSSTFFGHYFITQGQVLEFELDNIKARLIRKIASLSSPEIILALPMTIEGQVGCNYLRKIISEYDNSLKVSRLAYGLPAGGDLEYSDDGTILAAFEGRTNY